MMVEKQHEEPEQEKDLDQDQGQEQGQALQEKVQSKTEQQQQQQHQQHQQPQQQHQQHQQRRPRRQHVMHGETCTLWMGSIQPTWNEGHLLNLFASTQEVARVRMMRNNSTGLPAGYAFIEFSSHAAARHVLETFNGQPIPGTNLCYRLNWGKGGSGSSGSNGSGNNNSSRRRRQHSADHNESDATSTSNAPTSAGSSPSPRSRSHLSLYVGDLAPETTSATLKAVFAEKFATCVDANVLFDANTGCSKGYGFVRFKSQDDCRQALRAMQSALIDGRRVRVGPAARRPEGQSSSNGESSRRHDSPRHSNNTTPYAEPPAYMRATSVSSLSSRTLSSRSGSFSEVSHGSDDLNAPNVTHDSIAVSTIQKKPVAENEAKDEEKSTIAGAEITQREPATGEASANARQDADQPEATSDAEQSPPSSGGGRPAPRTTVFIGNLDPNVNADAIQAHFECCGSIESIKIPPNKGCGFVKFSTREEAKRAIDTLRGTMLGSQAVRLDWGKFSNNPRGPSPIMASAPLMYGAQGSPTAGWQQMPAMYFPGSPGAQSAMDFAAYGHAAYYGPYYPSSPPSSPMASVVPHGGAAYGAGPAAAAAGPGGYVYSPSMMYGAPGPMMSPPEQRHLAAMMAAQQLAVEAGQLGSSSSQLGPDGNPTATPEADNNGNLNDGNSGEADDVGEDTAEDDQDRVERPSSALDCAAMAEKSFADQLAKVSETAAAASAALARVAVLAVS